MRRVARIYTKSVLIYKLGPRPGLNRLAFTRRWTFSLLCTRRDSVRTPLPGLDPLERPAPQIQDALEYDCLPGRATREPRKRILLENDFLENLEDVLPDRLLIHDGLEIGSRSRIPTGSNLESGWYLGSRLFLVLRTCVSDNSCGRDLVHDLSSNRL